MLQQIVVSELRMQKIAANNKLLPNGLPKCTKEQAIRFGTKRITQDDHLMILDEIDRRNEIDVVEEDDASSHGVTHHQWVHRQITRTRVVMSVTSTKAKVMKNGFFDAVKSDLR